MGIIVKCKHFTFVLLALFLCLLVSPKASFAQQSCGSLSQTYNYACDSSCDEISIHAGLGCVDNNDGEGCITQYHWFACYYQGNPPECKEEQNIVTVSCDGSGGDPGPGGAGYEYTGCPAGQGLSCGTTYEAEAQNKTNCLYRKTCNKYFWPSSIGIPAPCNANPVSATCNWNCSCCPLGSSRTCTQGSQYIKDITIDMAWDTPQREALKVTCNTHNDIFISNVQTRNYWVGEDHYQDWRLTCRTNNCNCVAPTNTPIPTLTPTPTPWIRVNVKDQAGTAVKSSEICGVDCSGAVCNLRDF